VPSNFIYGFDRERKSGGIAAPTHIADKYSEDAITANFQVIVRDATSQ
jgi:hypothetical protein